MSALSEIHKIADDFIAHKVSAAYFARHVSESLYDLAKGADVSRANHGAMISVAQALFFMAADGA